MDADIYEVLKNTTIKTPITIMNSREKFDLLSSILLGFPQIKDWFRPRDLPFEKQAINARFFSIQLLELYINFKNKEQKIKDLELVKLTGKNDNLQFIEFITDLGLILRHKESSNCSKKELEELYEDSIIFILNLLLRNNSFTEGAINSSAQYLELEDFRNKYKKIIEGKDKESKEHRAFFSSLLNKEFNDHKFHICSIKLIDINKEFLNRWKDSNMKRGASYLVYANIAILREKILSELGPSSLIHDYAGCLYFIVPENEKAKFNNSWIQDTLKEAFDKGGWLKAQFTTAISDNYASELISQSFPKNSINWLTTNPMNISELLNWQPQLGKIKKENIESKIFSCRKENSSNENNKKNTNPKLCTICNELQYKEGLYPKRWKESREKFCPVCLLIAEGCAPAVRHRFLVSLLDFPECNKTKITFHAHLNSKLNTLATKKYEKNDISECKKSSDNKTGFFFADGHGVGKFINNTKGIYELKEKSHKINIDLHKKLREGTELALRKIGKDNESETIPPGIELLWLGGDDIVIRCQPELLSSFKKSFDKTDPNIGIKYDIGTAESLTDRECLICGTERAHNKMKEVKQKRRS